METIEEIHKGCGGRIEYGMYTSYPGIPYKRCQKCGEEKREENRLVQKEIDL